jgi:hypothetical protein
MNGVALSPSSARAADHIEQPAGLPSFVMIVSFAAKDPARNDKAVESMVVFTTISHALPDIAHNRTTRPLAQFTIRPP